MRHITIISCKDCYRTIETIESKEEVKHTRRLCDDCKASRPTKTITVTNKERLILLNCIKQHIWYCDHTNSSKTERKTFNEILNKLTNKKNNRKPCKGNY